MTARNKTAPTITGNDGKPTEYEVRVKAMTLAVQHQKNCSAKTLYRLADIIFAFLNGKDLPKEKDE